MNEKSITQNYGSTGYQNPYGVTSNVGVLNYKQYANPAYGAGWPALGRPDAGSSWSGSEGGFRDVPPYGPGYQQYPANHGYDYVPSAIPPNGLTPYNHYPEHHKYNGNGWKTIGTMVFIKLGFLKIMFILIYKMVIFTKLMFFKTQLIKKLMDMFNALPGFILELFSTIVKLFSMPGLLLLNSILRPVNNTDIPFTPGSFTLPSRLNGMISNLRGDLVTGVSRPSASDKTIRTGVPVGSRTVDSSLLSESVSSLTPGLKGDTSFSLDDLNMVNMQRYGSWELIAPTLDIFQNVLDSEKCVERIACQIAAVEKSGVMPLWFNW